jgi:hypothetical protein
VTDRRDYDPDEEVLGRVRATLANFGIDYDADRERAARHQERKRCARRVELLATPERLLRRTLRQRHLIRQLLERVNALELAVCVLAEGRWRK